MSILFPCVVWWINLCGGSWVELFRSRTDENDWCRYIFRESNEAADTRANWLMDNESFWIWSAMDGALISTIKCKNHVIVCCLSMGSEGESGLGATAWILWIRDEYGSFENVSYDGRVLRNA